MGDPETPDADEAAVPAEDAPQDPVQAARDDAWLAQFRAENAAKVVGYDGTSIIETQAEATAEMARRDFDLKMATTLEKDAATDRAAAAGHDKQAQQDAARHDEYTVLAETERQRAAAEEASAARMRTEAAQADASATRLKADIADETKIIEQHQREYELIQQQAVAAQRIADNEAKLSHPGDPVPGQEGEPPAP